MRELASEAAVSFATPFNQFGSKQAIMLALSARRIASMQERLVLADLPRTAAGRVLSAVGIAAEIMLAAPAVNRAVMGAIAAPNTQPGNVSVLSGALWAQALGAGEGLVPADRTLALAVLPRQLAIAFRGTLSFWTAGELPDPELEPRARAAAATAMLGFVLPSERTRLRDLLQA
jgi:AcrR family transcriptional regulator